MYRALTWWCLRAGRRPATTRTRWPRAVRARCRWTCGTDPAGADGARRTASTSGAAIRETRGQRARSARSPPTWRPRRLRELPARSSSRPTRAGIVAEGRDITTVVAPDADVRMLLTASEQARLARRARELHGTADADALAATRDQVVRRDRDDSTVSQFTVAADGVVTIDSSSLSFEEVVEAVLALVEERTGAPDPGTRDGPERRPARAVTAPRPGRRAGSAPALCGRAVGARCSAPATARRSWTHDLVPTTGPVIYGANHTGFIDGPLVFGLAPRPAHFIVKRRCSTARSGWLLALSARSRSTATVADRDGAATALARAARAAAWSGIFPEGSRGRGRRRRGARRASTWLALASGAPVVPGRVPRHPADGRESVGRSAAVQPARRRLRRAVHAAAHRRLPRARPAGCSPRSCVAPCRLSPRRAPASAARRHGDGRPARRARRTLQELSPTPTPAEERHERHVPRGSASTPSRTTRPDAPGRRPTSDRCDAEGVAASLRTGLDDYEPERGGPRAARAAATATRAATRPRARCRCWPSSAARTSASPRWSTASSAAARRSSRTCPGVTRDRVAYDANWPGRRFTLVDTGGWERDAKGIQACGSPSRPRSRSSWPTRCCSSSTRRSARPTPTRRSSGCCAGPASRSCSRANKVDDARDRGRRRRRCGRSGSASRTRSPRCTAGAAATCSTPCSTRCPRSAPSAAPYAEGGPRRVALLGRPNVGKSQPAQQAGRHRARRRRRGRRHDRATRSTSWSSSAARRGGSSTPPASGAGCTRPAGADYYASLRTAGRAGEGRGRGRAGRRRASRSPSRTCGSSAWSSTPAGRWSSPTTSGT